MLSSEQIFLLLRVEVHRHQLLLHTARELFHCEQQLCSIKCHIWPRFIDEAIISEKPSLTLVARLPFLHLDLPEICLSKPYCFNIESAPDLVD